MKTILRNFVSVLRRFKMAMLLNVFGLSIAFAAFMVIMMQVNYDYTFDSCQPEADAIYRVSFISIWWKEMKRHWISRKLPSFPKVWRVACSEMSRL